MKILRGTMLALAFALVVALTFLTRAGASDDMLIIEQEYNIVENAKDGVNAKDIRQILYVTRDFVCIDEYGVGGNMPTETYLLDLKGQRILNLDHGNKTILVNESFEERRARLQKKKREIQSDIADLPVGPQRNKIEKMYRAMLDEKRDFALSNETEKKEIAGADCKTVKISDKNDPKYVALEASIHPGIELPYDNSEVLYLLRIIGENMAAFLKENKAVFARVPMEMHLDLAASGRLDTKVTKVRQIKSDAFDPRSRPLGDPFLIPADYTAPKPRFGPKAPVESPKKERAD